MGHLPSIAPLVTRYRISRIGRPGLGLVRYDDPVSTPDPPYSAGPLQMWRDFCVAFGQVWEGYKKTPPGC